jgi:phosphomevalonate kinase
MAPQSYSIVSAPGKVLITGGYLILESTYSGLVIATDSRFYTIVRRIRESNESNGFVVRIQSPQFLDGVWEYNVAVKDLGFIALEPR